MRIKSIGMQLGLLIVVSIVLFVSATGFLSWSISKKALANNVSDAYEETASQTSGKLDFLYGSFEKIVLQMMVDSELRTTLTSMEGIAADTGEYAELARKLDERMQFYQFSNSAIASIEVLRMDGQVIPTTSGLLANRSYAKDEWFKNALANDGRSVWIEGNLEENRNTNRTFTLSRVIHGEGSKEGYCVVLIDLSLSALAEQVSTVTLGSGDVEIVGASGLIVYSPDENRIGEPSGLSLPAITAEEKQDASKDAGSFRSEDGGRQVVFARSAQTGWYTVASIPVGDLYKDAKAITRATLTIIGAALLFAVIVGTAVARVLGRRLGRLRDLMRLGAQGDLRVRADAKRGGDEISQLGDSFDEMMENVSRLIGQVSLSANSVLATASDLSEASSRTDLAAREIAAATSDIARGGEGLANEAERGIRLTSHSSEQAAALVGSSREMEARMRRVQESSELGIGKMKLLGDKTGEAKRLVEAMNDRVGRLQDSARSIRRVLDILTGLSKQTNILSLNATIEASRAGAAGKGFMVVAGEIRLLAEQSNLSIGTVAELTRTIEAGVDEAVRTIAEAGPIFAGQLAEVEEADALFGEVGGQMDGFVQALGVVSEAIRTLEASQQSLSQAMVDVSSVSEESLAAAQQVDARSQDQLDVCADLVGLSAKLRDLSVELQDSLARFTT